jgi:hypothetical protein
VHSAVSYLHKHNHRALPVQYSRHTVPIPAGRAGKAPTRIVYHLCLYRYYIRRNAWNGETPVGVIFTWFLFDTPPPPPAPPRQRSAIRFLPLRRMHGAWGHYTDTAQRCYFIATCPVPSATTASAMQHRHRITDHKKRMMGDDIIIIKARKCVKTHCTRVP